MIDYQLMLNVINTTVAIIFFVMLIVGWYYVAGLIISGKKVKPIPHSDNKTKFAIIIPARNEARVIKNSLSSMKKQTYDPNYFDVWVIVESEDDPTTIICRSFGYHYFVRKNLENRRTKGFAIQELINHFKENNLVYDAYMIFDADNVASPKYIETMNNLRQTGVQVGMGYRNYTNASENTLTCISAIFFSYMYTFTARMRTNLFKKSTICGTGFFVNREIIDDAGGWIFTGMTEDIQLTTWCYYHDVNMRYYPLIEFYDEQGGTWKSSHRQMIRWIWGYFEKRKEFKTHPEIDYHSTTDRQRFWAKFEFNLGIYPFVFYTISNFLLFLISFVLSLLSLIDKSEFTGNFVGQAFISFAILYVTFFLIALAVIIKDNKKLKFNFPTAVWTCTNYWLFFVFILYAFLVGLFKPSKRRTWQPVDHSGNITHENIK